MSAIVTVPFYGDTIFAVEDAGVRSVAIKPISDGLGLKWSGQHDKLRRNTILSEGIRVMRIPSPGGDQETVCLRLELLPGWLLTIDDKRIGDAAVRQKVLTYQRECFQVLYAHFSGSPPSPVALPADAPKPLREWPLDEMRTKKTVVDMYRMTDGIDAARWIMAEIGFPPTPPHLLAKDRHPDLFSGTHGDHTGERAA